MDGELRTTKRVTVLVGTRPELIKLAPVIAALRARGLRTRVVFSGQHTDLLAPLARFFGVFADAHLDVMRPGQSLASLTARATEKVAADLETHRPDVVIGQGDTTTVLAGALAAFYARIPFVHVEAGLRTATIDSPFPEEMNRRAVSLLTTLHCAPTSTARDALLAEGVDRERVRVTGNPVIDALLATVSTHKHAPLPFFADRHVVVVTMHRRENQAGGVVDVARAIAQLAKERSDVDWVWPVHPSPAVGNAVRSVLGGTANVHLVPPLDYGAFVALLARARIVLSDSGGIQEEAPALGVPVLVLREETERPEALAVGATRLVGTDPATVRRAVIELLDDDVAWQKMRPGASPYGDGRAALRIADEVCHLVGLHLEVRTPCL